MHSPLYPVEALGFVMTVAEKSQVTLTWDIVKLATENVQAVWSRGLPLKIKALRTEEFGGVFVFRMFFLFYC